MQTKSPKAPNAFKPYSQFEIDLILSLVPNKINTRNLAKSLGRTTEAIGMVYEIAFGGNLLKENLNKMKPSQRNVYTKVADAKRRFGIYIGYEP